MNTALLLLLIGLLVLLFLMNRRRKQATQQADVTSKAIDDNVALEAETTARSTLWTDAAAMPAPEMDQALHWDARAENATVSVETVDTLTEYKVYKQFGYHQKAAESLTVYLHDQALSDAVRTTLVMELASLWIQAKQPDALSEMLAQYRWILNTDETEQIIKQGLALDANHLGLRVQAEELLGWNVQQTAQEMGLSSEDMGGGLSGSAHVHVSRGGKRHKLVLGQPEKWHINREERDVLLGFAKPEQGYHLLKEQLVYEAAVRCLNKAISQSEKPASLIIDALSLDYRHQKLGVFAQHLWRLYFVLGQYGGKVKERMLGWGYNLGNHAMFDELSANPSELRLREIGWTQGLMTRGSSAQKAQWRALVTRAPNEDYVAETLTERILRDAESLLTYGQLDHAVELLENAIMEHPQESQFYIALFDLYERAEDWPRLEQMLHRIRDAVKTPPEEVVLAMSQLLQRIHHGGVPR